MQVCPSLLVKKDRGRPTDPKARPKAYGEVNVPSNVPGVELLDQDDDEDGDDMDEPASSGSDDDHGDDEMVASSDNDEDNQESTYDIESEEDDIKGAEDEDEDDENSVDDSDDGVSIDDDDDEDENEEEDAEDEEEMEHAGDDDDDDTKHGGSGLKDPKAKKRKLSEFDRQIVAADTSLRALKKLAGATKVNVSPDSEDGILSNEDFQMIKELKVSQIFPPSFGESFRLDHLS